jgi:hypothetical protein
MQYQKRSFKHANNGGFKRQGSHHTTFFEERNIAVSNQINASVGHRHAHEVFCVFGLLVLGDPRDKGGSLRVASFSHRQPRASSQGCLRPSIGTNILWTLQ